jgi:CRISPR-associated endonuclease/helicase Cas3
VAALVSAAYDEAMDHPAAWETVWQDAEAGERKYRTRQQEEAGRFCLPDPESGSLSDWTTVVTSDTEVRGLAQVRDADESVEVIVVQRRGDTIYALPHVRELAGKPLDGMLELDPGDARRLAQCSVRLPAWVAASEAQLLELEKGRTGILAGLAVAERGTPARLG